MPSYTLKRPVVLADKRQFAVLTMDGATLAGVAAHETEMVATGSKTAALVAMLAVECDWPAAAVGRIALDEMEAIVATLDPFGDGAPTGGTGDPSPPSAPIS